MDEQKQQPETTPNPKPQADAEFVNPSPPNIMRAMVTTVVKAANEQEREILHLITNASVDRAGDIVDPHGAETANYMRNPVVMANHEYRIESIIGKAVAISIDKDGIYARTKFRDTPLGQDAFKLAQEGLGGWSIGFRPMEYDSVRDDKGLFKGFRFKKWELLEYSIVAIPMNQDAVMGAVKRGLVTEANTSAFFIVQHRGGPSDAEVSEARPSAEVLRAVPAMGRSLRRLSLRLALAKLAEEINAAQETINARKQR